MIDISDEETSVVFLDALEPHTSSSPRTCAGQVPDMIYTQESLTVATHGNQAQI